MTSQNTIDVHLRNRKDNFGKIFQLH